MGRPIVRCDHDTHSQLSESSRPAVPLPLNHATWLISRSPTIRQGATRFNRIPIGLGIGMAGPLKLPVVPVA